MALIATTSDVRVTEGHRDLFTLTAHLILHDDVLVQDVIDTDYSVEYSQFQTNLTDVRANLGIKMQDDIDKYKREVSLISQANKDAAITWWNTNLTV